MVNQGSPNFKIKQDENTTCKRACFRILPPDKHEGFEKQTVSTISKQKFTQLGIKLC